MNAEAEDRIARGRQATRTAAEALKTMLATTNYSPDDWEILERAKQLCDILRR